MGERGIKLTAFLLCFQLGCTWAERRVDGSWPAGPGARLRCHLLCCAAWCFATPGLVLKELPGIFHFVTKSSSSAFHFLAVLAGNFQAEPLTGIDTVQMVDTLCPYTGETVHVITSFSCPVCISVRELLLHGSSAAEALGHGCSSMWRTEGNKCKMVLRTEYHPL